MSYHFGIETDKDKWESNRKIMRKLKDAPSMPNWWRFGFDSQEDMEDELNGKR